MDIKSKKPLLRFRGFTDAWEQYKLGEIGNTYTGLSGKTANDFGHGNANYVTYMNIFNNPITKLNELESIEIDKKQNQVKYGDIFFTTSSETPHEVGMSSVWLGNQENVYLNSFCFGYRPTIDHSSKFIAYLLRSPKVREDIILLAQGISRFNISKTRMMDNVINLPSIGEQEKIGELFYQLDNLITLHQRKHRSLLQVKSSLLDKLFPKTGENKPEIRFKGFTDTWEQRELREISIIQKGEQLSIKDFNETGEYYVLNGGINPSGYADKFNTLADTISISEGGNSCGYVNYNKEKFWSGGHNYTLVNPSIDVKFLYQQLKSKQDIIMSLRVGSGLPNIQRGPLEEFIIEVPNKSEQFKIGQLFDQLDNLITLHQRKYEKLINLKKSLLDMMFV